MKTTTIQLIIVFQSKREIFYFSVTNSFVLLRNKIFAFDGKIKAFCVIIN